MKVLLAAAVCLLACGDVTVPVELGLGCSSNKGCLSGFCSPDGVCCDRACDSECESCVAEGTGLAAGACGAALAGTDLRGECEATDPGTCGATGTGCNGSAAAPKCNSHPAGTVCGATVCGDLGAGPYECDGAGSCIAPVVPTSCGNYLCNAAGDACRTTCADPAECIGLARCAQGECVRPLRVVIEVKTGGCSPAESALQVKMVLEMRGHTVTFTNYTGVDTLAKLQAYDVLVVGELASYCPVGAGTTADWASYDAALDQWQALGGGVVASGWVHWVATPANIGAMVPVAGTSYVDTARTFTPVGPHPILTGVSGFMHTSPYNPYAVTSRDGATVLIQDQDNHPHGLAWDYRLGRVVYLSPLYFEYWGSPYNNKPLTDGTLPDAMRLLVRSIEWAGKAY